MIFLKQIIRGFQQQLNIISAIAAYDRNRQAAISPVGHWESVINPLQMMAFFILMRVGFSFLGNSSTFIVSRATNTYFNIIIFMTTGFCIAFLFRAVAIKSLSGLKLRAPLYYSRITPLDILLGLSLNDFRALSTLSLVIVSIAWYFTWNFRLDSPGLAVSVYLAIIMLALGFGLITIFLGKINKSVQRILKRLFNRIIIFTSGIFFATFEIPAYLRSFITWNPILHGVELFRYSINNEYPIPGISLSYLLSCSMLTLGLSFILYKMNESTLLESDHD
ncbi:ABC transporter permease [Synechococcus sp. M16CYN]|uniref:ABC transporter permease n=1 Tax=Synechococcus sp. M16CYN TaxID=3103139 RepID=UPI00324E9658